MGTQENEVAAEVHTPVAGESISPIVKAYNEAIYVDQTAVISARFNALAGFAVTGTEENLEAAKKTRAALNALAKDAGASRMIVQRAIKAHPIGVFAFGKTELEKRIEKESKRLDADIKRAENAPRIQLNENVETFVCFVTGTLAQINKLAVLANEQGLNFENRGPVAPEGEPQKSIDAVVAAEKADIGSTPPPPPPPPESTSDPIF